MSSLLSNLDHGSVPGLSIQIKNQLDIENFKFGLLGTTVYFGFLIGSIAGAQLFQKPNMTKTILITAMFFNGLTLFAFSFLHVYSLAILLRFVCGFFQVFFCIYAPVWGDAYGSHRDKSMWITLFSASSPLGIFLGFAFASVLNNQNDWKWAFYIQALLTVPCLAGLLITDARWLNIEEAVAFKADCQDRVLRELKLPPDYLQRLPSKMAAAPNEDAFVNDVSNGRK